MKKPILTVITAIVFVLYTACAGSPAAGGNSKPEDSAFTGDGGKGISLTILPLRATGLLADQNYIPALVQGEFVSNFTSYSAITPLDRLALEQQYTELLSGYYSDDAPELWDLGHLPPTTHIMTGNITRTPSGFALQISINRNTDKMTIASYSSTITANELNNLSGVRRASLDLMQKMGVTPTEQTKRSLSGAAAANEVNAQRALSRGIVAQQSGNEFEAMINYFEARTFNVAIPEASARTISAGTTLAANKWTDTGARARVLSEIEQMKESDRLQKEREANIQTLLKTATGFYKAHQPFIISSGSTFTYNNIDHRKGTVDISVNMTINTIESEMKIINDLMRQARSIGVNNWPMQIKGIGALNYWLVSNNNSILVTESTNKFNAVQGIWRSREILLSDLYSYSIIQKNDDPNFNIVVEITNSDGRVLKMGRFNFTNLHNYSDSRFINRIIALDPIAHFPARNPVMWTDGKKQSHTFPFTIKADNLTDTLIMRIVSVNGKSIDDIRRSGYVGIAQEKVTLQSSRYHNTLKASDTYLPDLKF